MNNGVTVPIGELVRNNREDGKRGITNYPEYIVYNTNQIRIRYLVQIKTS
jgi:hypothetical protein